MSRRSYCNPGMLITVLFLMTVVGAGRETHGYDENTDAGFEFFEKKIRPVLVRECYDCHSSSSSESGLRVDLKATIRTGGDRGPAVVPHHPEASLLLTAISQTDDDLKMPPEGMKLSDSVIADFRRWIAMGAPDPRTAELVDADREVWSGIAAAAGHWAYQPAVETEAPEVDDPTWPKGDIDRFVMARLTESGLTPSPDASARTLLRRMHFDLIGLPPSPASLDSFLEAIEQIGMDSAVAVEVDRLLQSLEFGEHWGRHWLDIARYGESSGGESNVSFPYAWRYRDYVINAVNADIPYNRFLTEQIAGDLLPYQDNAERARLLIATGFLAVGTKNLGENDDRKFKADVIDEQIDSLTRAVMSSSVACARCHHHKFDPFSMQDYYALAGIFASTETYFGTFVSPANNRGGHPLVLPEVAGQKIFNKSLSPRQFAKLKTQFAELDAVRQEIREAREALFSGRQPEKTFTLREVLGNIWRLGPVEGKLETLDADGRALPVAMGVLDAERIVDVPLLARGEIGREGKIIPRAFPQAIPSDETPGMPADQSGRREFAQWLTSNTHPLTSRVFVNRVWHHLFGQGLVATVDNFGTTGSSPSHPELLDTLAVRFTRDGQSLKRLVRRIVTSRTYRQASTFDPVAFRQDPENRWLWRMPKRRLTAESIRDAMLSVAGSLDRNRPDASMVATVIGDRPVSLIGLDKRLPKDLDGAMYRSVYLPVIRDRLPDVLELFDFAEPSLVTGQRETTNVPVQALYLMNSEFVQQRAHEFVSRLNQISHSNQQFVRQAFLFCFGREPQEIEMKRSLRFLAPTGQTADTESPQNKDLTRLSFCQAMLSTAEFRNLD